MICDDLFPVFPDMSRLVSGDYPNTTSGFPRKSRNESLDSRFRFQVFIPHLFSVLILGMDPMFKYQA